MMLAFLWIAVTVVQDVAFQSHLEDPLHYFAVLEVSPEGKSIEWTVDFEGTLHVWAASTAVDPRIEVERFDSEVIQRDDDSGGGTAAYLRVEVNCEDVLTLTATCKDGSGDVQLHWIAAPETEEIRAAVERMEEDLPTVEALYQQGELEQARERLEQGLDELLCLEGASQSFEVQRIAWKVGRIAYQLASLNTAQRAWSTAHEARKRLLPKDHPDLLAAKLNLAGTREKLGDLEGARELIEYVHAAWGRLLPKDHPDLLTAKLNLAVTRRNLGDLEGARDLFEYVHSARERLLPKDHSDLLTAKQGLAVTRKDLGDLEGARELFEYVHSARERLLPMDHPDLLTAKLNLAVTRRNLGDLEGARELFEYVHAARERLLPKDHPDLLTAKQGLAVTRKDLGDLEGARELFEYVHAAWERLLPKDHRDLLAAKLNLAGTREKLGDLEGVRELIEYVHAAWERLLPKDHPDLLAAKLNLAGTREKLGDLEGARELIEYVHAAWERLLPKDHPNLLGAKLSLASNRRDLGDLEGARELIEYVHAAWERLLPKDHPDLLAAKLNLAGTREKLGDLEGARELIEYVHGAWERLLPKDHPNLLAAKLNLASTREDLGDLEGARELIEYVHAARERLLPKDHPDLLTAKLNLAVTRRNLGDLEGARELFEYVHAVRERLLPKDHPDLLNAKQGLAVTRKDLGDLEGARELFEYVHAAWERLLPKDHRDLLAAKQNLAVTRKKLGDLEGLHVLSRSLLHSQLARAASLARESPRLARAAASREMDRLAGLLFWSSLVESAEGSGLHETLFAVLESLRQVSTSSHEIARAAAQLPELAELQARLKLVRGELADCSQTAPTKTEEMDAWRALLVEVAEKRDEIERAMRSVLEAAGIPTTLPTVQVVAKGLEDDALLVSFLRYRRYFAEDKTTGKTPPSVDSLLAFVVTRDGSVHRVELGAAKELEDLASRWRALLGKPIERGVEGIEAIESRASEELDAGRELREKLLDPCLAAAGLVAGADHWRAVHLLLDDFLHLLPMDALPLNDGRRLGEWLPVHVENSVRRLMQGRRATPEEGALVAFGNVDFGAEGIVAPDRRLSVATPPLGDSNDRSSGPTQFNPLLQSRYEVEAIGLLFQELAGGEPLLRTKAEASKKTLVELAPSARYLHLATHGWFAPESQAVSMLDRAGSTEEDFRFVRDRAQETIVGFLPETLCGLALAGANRGKDESGRVPGILTAEELATMDLSHCELAVLSACETNVGIRRAGQGIQSLQSALHAAGARTAITSLWKVDDAATRRLMELFYTKLWKDKTGKAEALWQAKMALRTEGHPIKDWAGWVLTGDPD